MSLQRGEPRDQITKQSKRWCVTFIKWLQLKKSWTRATLGTWAGIDQTIIWNLWGFVWFQDSLSLSGAFTFNRQRAPAISALSGFPRPDVEKPPTDLPLHPGANSFMFEDFEYFWRIWRKAKKLQDFEKFEEYKEKQKTSRILRILKNTKN